MPSANGQAGRFDATGYNRVLRNLDPVDNDQNGGVCLDPNATRPFSSALASDDSASASLDVEEIRKRLAETEKRLAQSESELHQHRLAKLTLEHTLDNVDIEPQNMGRPALGQHLSSSALPRHSPVTPSFPLGQNNIWSSGSGSNGVQYPMNPSPTGELTNWATARPIFDVPPQDMAYGYMPPGTNCSEPPTPHSASFSQTHFPGNSTMRQNANSKPSGRSGNTISGPGFALSATAGNAASRVGATPPETPVAVNFSGLPYPNNPIGRMPSGAVPKIGPVPRPNASMSQGMGALTRLSPTAAEFNVDQGNWAVTPTTLYSAQANEYTSMMPREHLYGDNWGHQVDKIVRANDQQSSILMQQKIKSVDRVEKVRMCDAIVNRCQELMTNRFGNFLVQRVLEHGTPEQVALVANTIRGRVVPLSMDAFGCHVVQKAFDTVPEEFKMIMIRELLTAIPDTVKHRYACHVWQKLFELRWSSEPPEIMTMVNHALSGQWWDVAMGETGSLVVQNIFENCNEHEKRPCIEEVLEKIDIIAKGQYGNWCIQHICEHGDYHDRSRAIEHILIHAAQYSMDQFASKVVEKCLKVCGDDFLDSYLARVCTAETGRTRVPLIDIACNQYGNYLIQHILQYAESEEHKQIVRQHAR
jgi:Pumilio-family RNA binding repeat